MYAQPNQTFGSQQPTYGAQQSTYGAQQPTYGAQYNQPFNQSVSNSMPSMNQSSFMNAQPISTLAPGLPPIEMAQPAIQQTIQRNPTPPPGWNDPPALKSNRAVSTKTNNK